MSTSLLLVFARWQAAVPKFELNGLVTLTFWPVNGVESPVSWASLLPNFSFLCPSILELGSGSGTEQTDRQRSSLHNASPYGGGRKVNILSLCHKSAYVACTCSNSVYTLPRWIIYDVWIFVTYILFCSFLMCMSWLWYQDLQRFAYLHLTSGCYMQHGWQNAVQLCVALSMRFYTNFQRHSSDPSPQPEIIAPILFSLLTPDAQIRDLFICCVYKRSRWADLRWSFQVWSMQTLQLSSPLWHSEMNKSTTEEAGVKLRTSTRSIICCRTILWGFSV